MAQNRTGTRNCPRLNREETRPSIETKDIFALAFGGGALVVSLVTLLLKLPENTRTIRNQLTDAMSKLNAVEAEARKMQIEREAERHKPQITSMFSFYNDQRAFLANQAVFLAEQIPDKVSSFEYSIIARALGSAGDFPRALLFWERTISVSASDLERARHLRAFGGFLLREGQLDRGRQLYQESIDSAAGGDDLAISVRGETYLRWAGQELEGANQQLANELANRAAQLFAQLKSVPRRKYFELLLANSPVAPRDPPSA